MAAGSARRFALGAVRFGGICAQDLVWRLLVKWLHVKRLLFLAPISVRGVRGVHGGGIFCTPPRRGQSGLGDSRMHTRRIGCKIKLNKFSASYLRFITGTHSSSRYTQSGGLMSLGCCLALLSSAQLQLHGEGPRGWRECQTCHSVVSLPHLDGLLFSRPRPRCSHRL